MLNIKLYTWCNLKSQGHGGDGKGDEKLGKTVVYIQKTMEEAGKTGKRKAFGNINITRKQEKYRLKSSQKT